MDWLLGIVVALVAIWVAFLIVFWLFRPRGVPIREVLAVIPDVVRLLRDVLTDRSTPADVRLVLVGLLAWILSPIDLIPEFIPVLGPIDDIVVAVVALRFVRRRLGIASLRARWRGTDAGFDLLLRVSG